MLRAKQRTPERCAMPAMTMREDQRAHRKVCGTFHVREGVRDWTDGGRYGGGRFVGTGLGSGGGDGSGWHGSRARCACRREVGVNREGAYDL